MRLITDIWVKARRLNRRSSNHKSTSRIAMYNSSYHFLRCWYDRSSILLFCAFFLLLFIFSVPLPLLSFLSVSVSVWSSLTSSLRFWCKLITRLQLQMILLFPPSTRKQVYLFVHAIFSSCCFSLILLIMIFGLPSFAGFLCFQWSLWWWLCCWLVNMFLCSFLLHQVWMMKANTASSCSF